MPDRLVRQGQRRIGVQAVSDELEAGVRGQIRMFFLQRRWIGLRVPRRNGERQVQAVCHLRQRQEDDVVLREECKHRVHKL